MLRSEREAQQIAEMEAALAADVDKMQKLKQLLARKTRVWFHIVDVG